MALILATFVRYLYNKEFVFEKIFYNNPLVKFISKFWTPKNLISEKLQILFKNSNFTIKSKFLSKIGILVKNRNFAQKWEFRSKIEFWSKIGISLKNGNFAQKSNFLSRMDIFVKQRIFSNFVLQKYLSIFPLFWTFGKILYFKNPKNF